MALAQRYVYGIHRVSGTVDDSNSLSMYLCTTAPVFVAVIDVATAEIPKGARGGGDCVGVRGGDSHDFAGGLIGDHDHAVLRGGDDDFLPDHSAKSFHYVPGDAVGMAGALGKAWKTVGARFANDSLKNEYSAKHEMNRGYYIRIAAAIAEDSWFGVGPNNWSYWVSNKYGPRLGWHFVPYLGHGPGAEPKSARGAQH